MNALMGFVVADPDFYAPLESARDRGEMYRPSQVPDSWQESDLGIWTAWQRAGVNTAVDGWKVHVSARSDRLAEVLDVVAGICFERDVPFKHLSARLFYQWTHQKHASRPQGGKFIAAYPPDVDTARALMERLTEALKDEEGPYILSDRRFPGSRVVHYRYGGFAPVPRDRPDGTRVFMVRNGHGDLVEDRRDAAFHLPEGVVDPFAPTAPSPAAPSATAREPSFGGIVFEKSIRHSNAGGTYRGRQPATGRTVFVKEARAHTAVEQDGLDARGRLRGEWDTLDALHRAAPGLAPEPIAYFAEWEHDFLVTEFVEGVTLQKWMVTHTPLVRLDATEQDFSAYYDRCEKLISRVEAAVEQLHACGYLFVDISPDNVLVDEEDGVRLVDFEAAHRRGEPFFAAGTPGYMPPRALVGEDPSVYDAYGLAALAQLLVAPLHHVVRRNPDALAHLHHDLTELAPVPPALWKRVTAFHAPGPRPVLPSAQLVAEAPLARLQELRDRVGDGLVAMADPQHPARIFPTVPQGYHTNTLCVAYGAAGVVHALHRAGREIPAGTVERLRRDALATAGSLPPGLHVGTAGIAWVLAEQGHLDEARALLDSGDRHPLLDRSATLFGGAAGVALAHLALYRHTRDEHHLDRATALARGIPADDDLVARLGADDATGLFHGRTGVALTLHQLASVTGDTTLLDRGLRLLHAELDRECDPESAGMSFPVSTTDKRIMPYLYCGSAGVVHVATRYLLAAEDERLAAAMPRLLRPLRTTYTVMPGLCNGLSSLGFALADRAALTGDQDDHRAAVRVGRALFKYAVPHATGVRFPGDQLLRHSADLWSGSAGILLFLTQLLHPRPDALFTIDAHPVTGNARTDR
ncbi:class III lanthionine synthetase LanKC [Streptomyces sp. NPDC090493]|uniref:class III lanthionine synthetase LanKC n=1 Tax=Streptomyces sp. NPDC090493 TaxID=3365964 RepID=UPI003828FEC2